MTLHGGGKHGLPASDEGGGGHSLSSEVWERHRGGWRRSGAGRLDHETLPGPVEGLTHLTGVAGRQADIVEIPLGSQVVDSAHVVYEPHVPPDMQKGTRRHGGTRGQVREGLHPRRRREYGVEGERG